MTTYRIVNPETSDVPAAPNYRIVPDTGEKPLAVNAGLADFMAGTLGLPMDKVQEVINLIRATQGRAAGALGLGSEWMPEMMTNIPGGSENVRNMLRSTGVPTLNPDNPRPGSESGTLAYEQTRRGGFIPHGVLPAAASIVAERKLGPEWAAPAALAPQAAATAYGAVRGPQLAAEQSRNTTRDRTIERGQDEGLAAPPSAIGRGWISKALEGFAGKSMMSQETANHNQRAMNSIARRELGVADDVEITDSVINRARNEARIGRDASGRFLPRQQREERLANIDAIEASINPATRDVIIRELVQYPVFGRLATVRDFERGIADPYTREASQIAGGRIGFDLVRPAIFGGAGYAMGGFPLAVATGAAEPFVRAGVRKGLLSDTVQRGMLSDRGNRYEPALKPAPAAPLLYQLGIIPQDE